MNKVKEMINKVKDFFGRLLKIKKPGVFSGLKDKVKPNKIGVLLVVLALLLGALYYFKNIFIVATVNGKPISRLEIIKRLEQNGGKETLDNAITEVLVLQEGKKLNALATEADVNAEIAKIREEVKASNQTLEEVLKQQNISFKDFEARIKLQKTVEKILEAKSVVTEEEIKAFIEANKASIPEGTDEKELRTLVEQQLKSQKLGNEFQSWIEMVKAKSSINYLVKYK